MVLGAPPLYREPKRYLYTFYIVYRLRDDKEDKMKSLSGNIDCPKTISSHDELMDVVRIIFNDAKLDVATYWFEIRNFSLLNPD